MKKLVVFGRKGCSDCEMIKDLLYDHEQGSCLTGFNGEAIRLFLSVKADIEIDGKTPIIHEYFNLETSDGLAELSIRGLATKGGDTPVPVMCLEDV